MLQEGKQYFEFGPYRLDPAAGVLTRAGEMVLLNPKAAETLAVLVRHHGRVVTKEELMKAVWPDAFVEDANLNVQISALRKALDDRAGAPIFVETIHRRGYRFRPEVQEIFEESDSGNTQKRTAARTVASEREIVLADAEGDEPALPRPSAPAVPGGRNRTGRILALSACLVFAAVVAISVWPRPGERVNGGPTGRFLIGVLPFANLSGDPDQEYLSDGLTEELITELGRLNPGQMGVIARTSMMPYKGGHKSIREVAQELGLRYVLEGGVVHAGPRLRITVKLIQASDQSQLWADEYDREFKNLSDVQREVARAVARQTFVHATPEAQERLAHARAVSPQAYDAYLKGRVYWWMRSDEGYQRARAYFEEALRIDPEFARAYAGLADISLMYGPGPGDPRTYARKAIALDDALAEAHASLGFAVWNKELDWTTAESEFRRALEIDPYYITARHWYGFLLSHWGRHEDAVEQLQRARETDPLNVVILTDLGQALFFAGQHDRGKEPLLKAIGLDPNFHWAHYWLGRILEAQGQFHDALSQYEMAADQPLSRMDRSTAIACLYAKMGRQDEARKILIRLESGPELLPRNRALVYAALGEKDRAIQALSELSAKYPTSAVGAGIDPGFASLRSDPRFQSAIAKVAPPAR